MNIYEEIKKAAARIGTHIYETPLLYCPYLSAMNEGRVYLKLENEQHTGSFKARGALNKVLAMTQLARQVGLITASTGNHGLGFARALTIAAANGTIVLPENADPAKVELLRFYKVELIFHGTSALEAELHARELARKKGKMYVSPYNDPYVIAGQGTIGKEITDRKFRMDDVLACAGGGGLMSGLAIWFQGRVPEARMVACLPENSPELYMSVLKGEIVDIAGAPPTLSDASAGGLEQGSITFDICRQLVKDYTLVSEVEIAAAIRFMAEKHHKIIEGAAGVALASFLKEPAKYKGRKVAIVLCGGNIAFETLKRVLCEG